MDKKKTKTKKNRLLFCEEAARKPIFPFFLYTCSAVLLAWTSRSAAGHNECNFHKRLDKRSACLHSWLTVKQHESIWQTVLDVAALLFVIGQRNWYLLSLKGKTIH